jgi:hypothetical protein
MEFTIQQDDTNLVSVTKFDRATAPDETYNRLCGFTNFINSLTRHTPTGSCRPILDTRLAAFYTQ